MIKCEEGGNPAIDALVSKIKTVASQQTEEQQTVDSAVKQSKKDLLGKLKEGIMSDIERKMHQHSVEQENMEREIKTATRDLDKEVELAKEQAKGEISQALSKKEQLQKELEGCTDEEEKKRLLAQLSDVEGIIARKLQEESASQESELQKKLAARRKKRGELAEK